MFSFVSKFGSSKGMVTVPNLLGVNNISTANQLASSGLRASPLSGTRNTNVLSQGGVSLSQSPAPGAFVDYETEITITFGNYVADTVTISPNCETYGTTENDPDYCSGTLYVYGSARTKRRKTVTTTNNVTGEITTSYDYSCTDSVVPRGSEYINGQCGYSPPPKTCTSTISYGAYGACNAAAAIDSRGTKTRTVSGTSSNCEPFSYPESATCCQHICNPWSDWDTLPSDTNKERRGRLCQYEDCSKKVEEQQRCKTTTTTTYGGCGSKNTRIKTVKTYVCGIWQSTTTTTINCQIKL
jgi:hypothetical protein